MTTILRLNSIFVTALSGPSGLVTGRPSSRAQACVVDGRLFGAFDGGRMIGSARYYDLRQWWFGRALPLAGVASVKIEPEARGRGIGRALMAGLLSAMNERGDTRSSRQLPRRENVIGSAPNRCSSTAQVVSACGCSA